MKNLKYLFLTLLGALAFVACSDDDVREADWSGIQGDGVYFEMGAQTSYLLEADQSSLKVPVMRSFTEGALTVMVSLTDDSGIFVADQMARFADGEEQGSVEIVFDFDDVEAGVAYKLTLMLLDDSHKSGYGEQELTFTVKYDPWTLVGKGYYRDDIISSNFNILTPYAETQCEVYESDVNKGVYRLANVYNSPSYSGPMFGYDPVSFAGNVQEGYIILNCQNPDKVYMVESNMGLNINSAYGWMTCGSICPENGFENYECYGKMVNGVITFDVDGLFLFLPLYNGGYTLRANSEGMTRVVMPGASAVEPVVTVDYEGVLIDPNSNASAIFNLELNADAEVVYFAAVDAASDLNAALAGMLDGSVECEEITESGEFVYNIYEPGQYVGIFLPATKDGSVLGTPQAVPFEYSAGGMTPSQFAVEFSVEVDETEALIGLTPNTDKYEYYWDLMDETTYGQIIATYGSIEAYTIAYLEYVAGNYGISVADVLAVYASKGAVEPSLYEGLAPGTKYILYAYCVNMQTGEARSEISTSEFETLTPAPLEADYEAILGTWTITSTSSEVAKQPMSFDIAIEYKKSNTSYAVYGWAGNKDAADTGMKAFYQAGDAENDALFYIPEQMTETYFNTQYGTAQLCLFGRYYEAAGNNPGYTFAGVNGAPCLVGGLTDATNGKIEPWQVTIEEEGQEITLDYTGADFFLLLIDGDYAGRGLVMAEDFAVGPFTMKKVAAEPARKSLQNKEFSMVTSADRENMLKKVNGKLARRAYLKSVNCVMVR